MDTDFFLAGGLAFLIALLGWGDQIRNTQERTRRLERALLDHHNFRWSDLRPLIRSDSPENPVTRLAAVLRVLNAGGLASKFDVHLLKELGQINKMRTALEQRYSTRFLLVFATSIQMLISGVLASLSLPEIPVPEVFGRFEQWLALLEWNHIWALIWMGLVFAILYQTFKINSEEQSLREGIVSVDDKLRRAKDERDAARRSADDELRRAKEESEVVEKKEPVVSRWRRRSGRSTRR